MNKIFHLVVISLLLIILSVVASSSCFAMAELEANLEDLAAQILTAMDEKVILGSSTEKIRIAVLDFLDLEGKVTSLGRFVAEELTTRLFRTKHFEVIERQLLNKVLEELKLNTSGFVDSGSAQELGSILGASAIVSGTLSDLGELVRINARLIATNTGTIFAAASTQIARDEAVDNLLSRVIAAPEGFIPTVDPMPSGSGGETVAPDLPLTTETGAESTPQMNETLPYLGGEELSRYYPNEEGFYRYAIDAAIDARDYLQAFSLCREAIDQFPGFAFAYAVLGYTYLNIQPSDRVQARTALEKALTLEEYPLGNGYTYYLLGRLYLDEGRAVEAKAALEKGVIRYRQATGQTNKEHWYEEAIRLGSELYQAEIEACWQRLDYGGALALSQQAILSFNSAYAYAAQGYSLLQLNRANAGEAVSIIRQGLDLAEYPAGDGWTYYVLGWAYWESGDKTAAQAAFEKAISRCRQIYLFQQPDWLADCLRFLRQIYHQRTQFLLEKQEYGSAITFLEEAVRLDPEYAFGYAALGFCYLQTGKPAQRAIVVLQKAFNLEEHPAGDGWANYVLGRAFKEKGENYLAKESLTKALRQAEKMKLELEKVEWIDAVYTLLQKCYEQLFTEYKSFGGKPQEYLVLAEESISFFPKFAYAYAVKGYTLMQGSPRDNQGAMTSLRTAITLTEYPAGDGWTYYILGWVYQEKGETKQAVAYFEKALNRCREIKRYPQSLRWYQRCNSLLRELLKRSTTNLGVCLDLTESQRGIEPGWRIEIGSGRGIPLQYYNEFKFRFGSSPDCLQAELGGEFALEGAIFPESTFGWYTAFGGGGYGTYFIRDDWNYMNFGFYLTLGGGVRLYLHRASGLRLTLGSEYQFKFGTEDQVSLVASISLPQK